MWQQGPAAYYRNHECAWLGVGSQARVSLPQGTTNRGWNMLLMQQGYEAGV